MDFESERFMEKGKEESICLKYVPHRKVRSGFWCILILDKQALKCRFKATLSVCTLAWRMSEAQIYDKEDPSSWQRYAECSLLVVELEKIAACLNILGVLKYMLHPDELFKIQQRRKYSNMHQTHAPPWGYLQLPY